MTAGEDWRTQWRVIAAAVWNEHHDSTVPRECDWVLVGASTELDGTPIASMGFALTDELMRDYTMDEFIDEIGFPELLVVIEQVRPVGDLIINRPNGDGGEVHYARSCG